MDRVGVDFDKRLFDYYDEVCIFIFILLYDKEVWIFIFCLNYVREIIIVCIFFWLFL